MLKKIRLNNFWGIELENKIQSGEFKPTEVSSQMINEIEKRAKLFFKKVVKQKGI